MTISLQTTETTLYLSKIIQTMQIIKKWDTLIVKIKYIMYIDIGIFIVHHIQLVIYIMLNTFVCTVHINMNGYKCSVFIFWDTHTVFVSNNSHVKNTILFR